MSRSAHGRPTHLGPSARHDLNRPAGLTYPAFALMWLGMAFAWPFTIDDAYIVARYAENLAAGRGYGLNPGAPSDGLTGPLWIVPAYLAALAGVSTVGTQKALGALAYTFGAALVVSSLHRRVDRGASGFAALALALPASALVWSVGGLETGGAVMAMSALVAGVVSKRIGRGHGPWLAALALPWLRPDAVPAALCLCLAGRRPRRDAPVLLLSVLGTSLFRVWMFDAWLPLSFWAKGAPLGVGVGYVLMGVLSLSGGAGLVFIAASIRSGTAGRGTGAGTGGGTRGMRRGTKALLLACLIHLVGVAAVGGDWMPAHRLLVPIVPALAVLSGWGGAAIAQTRPKLAFALGITFVAAMGVLLVAVLPPARGSAHHRDTKGRVIAAALADEEGPLALVDAGYLGWATDREIVDLGGITDPVVAAMPGTHVARLLDAAYLDRRAPSQFLLHSSVPPDIRGGELRRYLGFETENRLVRSPWFRRHYAPVQTFEYSPAYWYVLFERR